MATRKLRTRRKRRQSKQRFKSRHRLLAGRTGHVHFKKRRSWRRD